MKKLPTAIREHLKEAFILKPLYTPQVVNGVSKMGDSLLSHSDIAGGGVAARLGQNSSDLQE